MPIGDHIRAIREAKKLSQGDIEKRCGLKRAYISRVEHGHTVPSVETLEKLARALEIPLYRLFYEGEKPPKLPKRPKPVTTEEIVWGRSKKEARILEKFRRLLARMALSLIRSAPALLDKVTEDVYIHRFKIFIAGQLLVRTSPCGEECSVSSEVLHPRTQHTGGSRQRTLEM